MFNLLEAQLNCTLAAIINIITIICNSIISLIVVIFDIFINFKLTKMLRTRKWRVTPRWLTTPRLWTTLVWSTAPSWWTTTSRVSRMCWLDEIMVLGQKNKRFSKYWNMNPFPIFFILLFPWIWNSLCALFSFFTTFEIRLDGWSANFERKTGPSWTS